jgi:hypothetical protein
MSGFEGTWLLCGGWAVDAWLGRPTRHHGDTDIAVFTDDLPLLRDHLSGWQLVAHDPSVPDDTSEPWDGRPLDLPAHLHGRAPGARQAMPGAINDAARQGFGLDVQINERLGGDWLMSRKPELRRPLAECIGETGWGVPAVTPEVLLFYKAEQPRAHDEMDLIELLPHLDDKQTRWLRSAISALYPDHRWLQPGLAERWRTAAAAAERLKG